MGSKRDALKFSLILFWLVFTVAFALWWLKLSVSHVGQLALLEPDKIDHWQRQRRMLFWEGSSWIFLLVIGGGALIGLVERERFRVRRIKEFFASFSHEIKTSLASLRLQAEALKESGEKNSPILDRLIGDTVRLQVQLENSLFLASQDSLQVYVQPLSLKEVTERMREQWPNLKIELNRNCTLRADERALRTILSNLVQNALVHGRATEVSIQAAQDTDPDRVTVDVRDNGSGFEGTTQNLGNLFFRPRATSGSGLGIYICRILSRKMNGDLLIEPSSRGFHVRLILPGSLA